MNISTRERILLILMGAALVLFLSYSFLIKPLLDSIAQTDIDIAVAQEQKSSLDITAAGKKAVEAKSAELDAQLQETLKAFYPQLETKAVLKFLNDSVGSAGLIPTAINLSQPSLSYPNVGEGTADGKASYELYDMAQIIAGTNKTSEPDEQPAQDTTDASAAPQPLLTESREAQISFSGNFAKLHEFMSTLEEHDKSIVVSSFNFERDGTFEGNIAFTIFALPKPFADDSGFPAYK